MAEIRIRYDDDSDRMPYAEIAEIVKAAGKYLPVTEFEWIRDDDLVARAVERNGWTGRFA